MSYYPKQWISEWVPEEPITLEDLKNILIRLQEKYGKNARLQLNAGYNNISVEIEPTKNVNPKKDSDRPSKGGI